MLSYLAPVEDTLYCQLYLDADATLNLTSPNFRGITDSAVRDSVCVCGGTI